ncbi:MAG: TusE/DsrC/DsvC family sulfur relay protein [Deltaproteobacteria bacterium]|nr:TusE/DsrC/DsvC family sulfur relay protein [Deltaproteobacteria bacterium]
MPHLVHHGRQIELNDSGFLLHPEEWDRELAAVLAESAEGIAALTEEHWAVVDYIRDFYLENKLAPLIRLICKSTGFTLKHIYQLFPSGPAMGAAKVAGLPRPDGCV